MKYTRMCSVAIVAIFTFSAFMVVMDSGSLDADSTDHSSSAYVKIENMSKSDFESLYNESDSEIFNLQNIYDVIGDLYNMELLNNCTTELSYKTINFEASRFSILDGASFEDMSAEKISATDLVIKLKAKSDISNYYSKNSSDESIFEIINYLGTDKILKDTEIIIKFANYSRSSSSDYVSDNAKISDTTNYLFTKEKYRVSQYLNVSAEITINEKTITVDKEFQSANITRYTYDYNNTAGYSIGSYYNKTTKYDQDNVGNAEKTTIVANGKEYVVSDHSTETITKNSYESTHEDYSVISTIESYHSLPDKKYTYSSILKSVSSENDVAKSQIENKGGKCDTTSDSAEGFNDDCFYSCITSFKSEDQQPDNTGLITALIIVVIIAVALTVVLVLKTNKLKKDRN